jgi:hypothetical protein
MATDVQRTLVQRLVGLALKQEVFVTGVNAIVGWIIYNVLLDVYGFSWPNAMFFGALGYLAQVVMFKWMLSVMRGIQTEARLRVERQRRITDFISAPEGILEEVTVRA